MKERTRRILIMAVMAALIVSLMAASFSCIFTYGRYSGGRFDENSPYEDYIDFVGATAFTVKTPEELTNAIENGYSYIEIDEGAEEPFVVNDDIANVTTNLVLDVNGTTVIRNSRNPLLDVKRSVSVVLVYDSSTEQAGGFYNPVGSALQTSGGTLTVGAGVYESGPNEKYQTESYQTGQQVVTLFKRGEDRKGPYLETVTQASDLPILTGRTTTTDGFSETVYDYYFESAPEGNVNSLIEDDTYLIYTKENNCYEKDGKLFVNCTKTGTGTDTKISGTSFSVESNVASCDFYYYYPVSGTAGTEDAFQEYAVVYGYHDVKSLASNEKGAAETLQESGLVWPYAAIRSEAGNTHARGGAFKTHFGEENTYCIYSAGGTMTVGGTAEPKFSAVQSGVCIRMREGGETAEQRSAPSLTIDSGEFSSELGDTIKMSGGEMEVKKGKFTKTGCKKGTDAQLENQTAIISLTGGTLNVSGTKTGDTYSVTMTAGGTENGGTLENVFGIRADDGGTISTKGVSFQIYGDYSAGVLSYNGKIDLGNDTAITVTQSDANNNTLLTSAGVSSEQASEGEEHPVNLSGGVTITSNGLGITARGVVNVTGGTSTVETTRGTGIYVNNGQFKVDKGATINVNSTVLSGYSWTTPPESETTNTPNIYNGVYVQGGSLVSEGTLNVTFTGVKNDEYTQNDAYLNQETKSYAVRVEAAAAGDDAEVIITAGTIINQVQYDEQRKEIAGGGGGVLVNGGTVTLGKQETTNDVTTYSGPTVQTTGREVGSVKLVVDGTHKDTWGYYCNISGGDAIKVANGSLNVLGGNYSAAEGSGILIRNGTAEIDGGTFSGSNQSGKFVTGMGSAYAFKVLGGSAVVNGGTFNSAGGGAFVMGTEQDTDNDPNIKVYGGNFIASGATAFAIWNHATVLFAPKTDDALHIFGASTGLTVEVTTEGDQTIEVQGGIFHGGQYDDYHIGWKDGNHDGIWYGNGNAKLTISGGTFQGDNRSGLWFDVTPEIYEEGWIDGHGRHYSTNVKITGGGFKGNSYAIYAKESGYWESGSWNERPSYAIGVNYIIVPGSLLRTDNWNRANAPGGTSVGYGQWNPDYWNDALEGTIINCKKIAVGQYYIETWWQQN